MSLPIGLYDQLITDELVSRVDAAGSAAQIDNFVNGGAAGHLLDLMANTLSRLLESFASEPKESMQQQLQLVNSLLLHLRGHVSADGTLTIALPQSPLRRLRAIRVGGEPVRLPVTGLAAPWLFTASKASPSLYHEI